MKTHGIHLGTRSARVVSWLVLLGIGWAVVPAASAGHIRYPALGNIRLPQGTIEMWLIPTFEPEAPIEGNLFVRRLFHVGQDADNALTLMWRTTVSTQPSTAVPAGVQRGGFYPTGRIGGKHYVPPVRAWHVVGQHDQGWSKGEPRHVAFCWDGSRVWWIVDGEETVSRQQDRAIAFNIHEGTHIIIGRPQGETGFIVRDIRISSIPRSTETVGYHYPEGAPADLHTLLLDRLDEPFEPDGDQQTRPVVLAPMGGHRGGIPDETTSFVDTPFGTGLKL